MDTEPGTDRQRAKWPAGRARHPLHPPLTDVTIGAYTFATLAVVLSKLGVAEHEFAQAWWLALVVAASSSVLTGLTGYLDWRSIAAGTPLKKTATLHAASMGPASVTFVLAIILGHDGYVARSIEMNDLVLTLVGFGLLAVGGAIGGSLVFVHGMRVQSHIDAPETDGRRPARDTAAQGTTGSESGLATAGAARRSSRVPPP